MPEAAAEAGRASPPDAANDAEEALVASASPIGAPSSAGCSFASSSCGCASASSAADSSATISGVNGCVLCENGLMRLGPRSRCRGCVADATHAAVCACVGGAREAEALDPGRGRGEGDAALRDAGRKEAMMAVAAGSNTHMHAQWSLSRRHRTALWCSALRPPVRADQRTTHKDGRSVETGKKRPPASFLHTHSPTVPRRYKSSLLASGTEAVDLAARHHRVRQ